MIVRVAIDELENECANAVVAPLREQTAAVGRRGLGPRDQEEQRTQRASLVAKYHKRVHTVAAVSQSSCWARYLVGKKNTCSTSARLFAARLESVSAGLSDLHSARLFVAPDPAEVVVDVGYDFQSPIKDSFVRVASTMYLTPDSIWQKKPFSILFLH